MRRGKGRGCGYKMFIEVRKPHLWRYKKRATTTKKKKITKSADANRMLRLKVEHKSHEEAVESWC